MKPRKARFVFHGRKSPLQGAVDLVVLRPTSAQAIEEAEKMIEADLREKGVIMREDDSVFIQSWTFYEEYDPDWKPPMNAASDDLVVGFFEPNGG